jgi:hypothetical protein
MKTFRIVVVCALALAFVGVAAPARALPLTSLGGIVTDTAGVPLEHICVDAYAQTTLLPVSNVYYAAMTDAAGDWVIADVDPGNYALQLYDCWGDDFVPQWWDGVSRLEEANLVRVGPGSSARVSAHMFRGSTISGTLTDTFGDPAQTCVNALNADGDPVSSTFSGDDGAYALDGLAPGTYTVRFECVESFDPGPGKPPPPMPVPPSAPGGADPRAGYVGAWYGGASAEEATPVEVGAEENVGGIDGVLTRGGGIAGTVTNASGEGLDSICIDALAGGTWVTTARTGYDGTYLFRGLAEGEHTLYLSDCGDGLYERVTSDAIDVVAGAVVDGVDQVLNLRARPDLAVTGLSVRNMPLQTDVAALPGAGLTRTVDVSVANLGTAPLAWQPTVEVFVTSKTDDKSKSIGMQYVHLAPGESTSFSFTWNAAGQVGDVSIAAVACAPDDADNGNDVRAVEHYALVGGTGFGVTVARRGFPGCTWLGGPGPGPVASPTPVAS